MTSRVVSVSQLSGYVRQLLESDELLADIWVEAEVTDVFVSRAGHVYFTMADEACRLKAVLFRGMAERQRVLPAVGDRVAAHGRVSVYEREGTYQFYVDVLEHAGQGLLALQFERLRQKLEADGLFDGARKRPLPPLPRFIGVVTSAEGAVWHDIKTVMARRYPLAHLILSSAPVQGSEASARIVEAIERIQRDGRAQLLIVARGGGSAEDLACFNDERVARAIYACKVPVISAIGHETDWTIADLVADVRAATPSAAAELCAPSTSQLQSTLDSMLQAAHGGVMDLIRQGRKTYEVLSHRTRRHSPKAQLAMRRTEAQRLRRSGGALWAQTLAIKRTELAGLRIAAAATGSARVAELRSKYGSLAAFASGLDPIAVIRRGFAAIEHAESLRPVVSASALSTGDSLALRLHDGRIGAVVRSVALDERVASDGVG